MLEAAGHASEARARRVCYYNAQAAGFCLSDCCLKMDYFHGRRDAAGESFIFIEFTLFREN